MIKTPKYQEYSIEMDSHLSLKPMLKDILMKNELLCNAISLLDNKIDLLTSNSSIWKNKSLNNFNY